MKNLLPLVREDDIHDYLYGLWRTDLFRKSHKQEGGYINKLVQQFAKMPRIFYDMTDQHNEQAHFSAWFNAFAHRPYYDNPTIHDLYIHHDVLAHSMTMRYDPKLPWNRWYTKTTINEFDASMESEVLIYFYMPGLRDISFKHEIWVDRLLADPANTLPFEDNSPMSLMQQRARIEVFRDMRKRVMTSPDPFDFLELQIADYVKSNLTWSRIWARRYVEVETHMAEFVMWAGRNREEALFRHHEWLMEKCKESEIGIPFDIEARKFADHYWANKKQYGNEPLEAVSKRDQGTA